MCKILVPLTLSDASHAALPIAIKLAQETGAAIVLLHVVPAIIRDEHCDPIHCYVSDQMRQDAEMELNRLVGEIPARTPAEVVIDEGHPGAAIVRQAGLLGAEVVVMCSHGQRGCLKWLHRNTALYVAKHAPCAVWTVSPAGNDHDFTLTLTNPFSQQPEPSFWETASPLASLLKALFPNFQNTGLAGKSRKDFTLNLTVK